ncbi:hypothetical protein WH87_04860 [Devosia epidermidihirudinis]|uniref:Uncharacterized protein n=1 Tax=Devosia epidermidihirudinis TaxID=1293439 RepID=A0A0F5QFK5_9HYPH|nr:hypothetical protein [Devosia epidermidihirudinis]KKC39526.1 hypothetical protein WH87_04860 [Devosia epidermidihirudinis]
MADDRRTARRPMNSLSVERYLPYGIAIVATLAWQFVGGAKFPGDPSSLLAATGTAAAVFVGFLATMNAIILSVSGSPIFQTIRSAGYQEDLLRYVHEATIIGVTLLCYSIIGFFVVSNSGTPWIYNVVWVLISTCTVSLFVRVSRISFKLLKKV